MSKASEQWRAELLRIYDEAYKRKHGKKPEDPDTGGARVRRKPRPAGGNPGVMEAVPVS